MICHWIMKVIVIFFLCPSSQQSMCAFHFPHENKVRPKLHWGLYLFLTLVMQKRLVRGGEHRKGEDDTVRQYGKTRLLRNMNSLKSICHTYSIMTMSLSKIDVSLSASSNSNSVLLMKINSVSDWHKPTVYILYVKNSDTEWGYMPNLFSHWE